MRVRHLERIALALAYLTGLLAATAAVYFILPARDLPSIMVGVAPSPHKLRLRSEVAGALAVASAIGTLAVLRARARRRRFIRGYRRTSADRTPAPPTRG